MSKSLTPLVLGIESSCDETGVGIVLGRKLLANEIASSVAEHARFGGVVPEVAARAHVDAILPAIERALKTAKVKLTDLASKYLYYIHDCVMEYIEEFGQLKDVPLSNNKCLKLQRTLPMGGYHVWHYENGDLPGNFARELVWMIYLNDMPTMIFELSTN